MMFIAVVAFLLLVMTRKQVNINTNADIKRKWFTRISFSCVLNIDHKKVRVISLAAIIVR